MSTKKREKRPVIAVGSIQEAEQIMGEYAQADARIAKITATMDEKIARIRAEYAEELQVLNDVREEKFNRLQHFAESNPQMFGKKKSCDMAHGLLGFRTGTPKLKLIKKFTWGAVVEMLKEKLPMYVRTVDEPNKEMLLADRDVDGMDKMMEKCGVQVVQEESFYVELKKEEVATI